MLSFTTRMQLFWRTDKYLWGACVSNGNLSGVSFVDLPGDTFFVLLTFSLCFFPVWFDQRLPDIDFVVVVHRDNILVSITLQSSVAVRLFHLASSLILTLMDPGFLKGGGVHLRSTNKRGGSNFGPNVKKPTSWPKRGARTPWTPPPWIRHCNPYKIY